MAEKEEKKTVTPLPQVEMSDKQRNYPSAESEGITPAQQQQLEQGVSEKQVFYPSADAGTSTTSNAPATKPQEAAEAQQQAAPTESKKPYDLGTLYQDMVKRENFGLPSKEQLEEERKRNKRNALLATIGDGLAAFHKAYSHARGVKPMELENLSDKMYNRLEKIRKERQANELAYQNARLRAAGLDQRADIETRKQDRLDKETKIKESKAEAYRNYQDSLATKNAEMAAYYRAKWQALEEGQSVEEALKKAKTAQAEAAARLSNVRADAGGFAPKGGNGSGGVSEYTVEHKKFDKDGNLKGRDVKVRRKGSDASSSSKGGGKNNWSQYEVK